MLDSLIDFLNVITSDLIIETIAVTTGLIYVWLATKGSYWCFIFGMISSLIYLYICFQYNLYFDVGINIFYVLMSIGGWINWRKNTKQNSSLRISVLQKNRLVSLSISGLLLTILLAEFATRFSDASLPYLDAFTTIFAILGTILVIQRKLENWIIWVFVDLVATGMYLYKGLYLTSILFFTYTIIAISGYFSWKKKLTND